MQVITCGCSWANGAELEPDQVPFGHLVAQHLGAIYLHMAQDAASIPHMVLQLRSAISKIKIDEPAIALFLLTGPDRDLMWSCSRPIGTGHMKDRPPPYSCPQPIFLNGNDPLHKDWFEQYHSKELASYRANTSILALQTICQHHGVQDYYAWAFDQVDLWSEISKERFYKRGDQHMVDQEYTQQRQNYRIKHPDQAQHELIAYRFLHMIQKS